MQQINRRYVLTGSVAAIAVTGLGPARAQTAIDHVVTIKKFKFVPAEITVRIGDTITWVNKDLAPHTATSDAKDWSTDALKKGQSETVELTAQTTTGYFCKFHPNMKGRIIIE